MASKPKTGSRGKLAAAAVALTAMVAGLATAAALTEDGEASSDDTEIFCDEFVPSERSTWASGKVLSKWASQNPGERGRFVLLSDAICAGSDPALPAMSTQHGMSLLAVAKMALSDSAPDPTTTTTTTQPTTPPPPPPPPPPPSLRWPAPTLTSPTTLQASNTNRFFDLAVDRDYVIDLPSTPITARGGITIKGGNDVVIVGGEIRQDTLNSGSEGTDLQYGIYLLGSTGTVHLEGLRIHGAGIGQGVVVMPDWNAGRPFSGTLQIQNTRIESLHPVGWVHTDGIQSGSGPSVLRLYNVTIRSTGLSIQVQPSEHGNLPLSAMRQWDYERVNMEHLSNLAPALNKTAFGGTGWWPEAHKDLWLLPHPNHSKPIHCSWQGLPNCWNPGGGTNVSGEALNIGVPPAGDFAPASTVGLNYQG